MLNRCNDYPKHKIPTIESDESIHLLKIKFHIYEVFTILFKHGTIEPGNFLSHVYSYSVLL